MNKNTFTMVRLDKGTVALYDFGAVKLHAYLNQALLTDLPQLAGEVAALPGDEAVQRRLLRTLMNIRPAELPLDQDFLTVQDAFLSAEREAKGVVDADVLPDLPGHPGISLWQGDMTRLKADAIVNAANRALLGCFHPCHGCIDNAIHSAAARYAHFLQSHTTGRVLFLELGVGYNTPGVIKYPFWRRTRENPDALYVCVNRGEALVPPQLGGQAIAIDGDIAQVVRQLQV